MFLGTGKDAKQVHRVVQEGDFALVELEEEVALDYDRAFPICLAPAPEEEEEEEGWEEKEKEGWQEDKFTDLDCHE